MKELGLIYQIVGVADGEYWSQVRVAIPLSHQELQESGGLLAVICLPEAEGVAEKGGEWLEEITERFQAESSGDRRGWLKQILLEMEEKIPSKGGLLLGVVEEMKLGRLLTVGGVGEGVMVGIGRGGRKGRLWSSGMGVVKGRLQADDELLIGTKMLGESIWEKVRGRDLEERVEQARLMTVNQPGGGRVAGVIVKIAEEELSERGEDRDSLVRAELVERSVPRSEEPDKGGKEQNEEEREEGVVRRGRIERPKGLHLRVGVPEKKQWRVVMVVVVAILLLISIGFSWWQRQRGLEVAAYNSVVEPIEHKIKEAEELKEINPFRARTMMVEVREEMVARESEMGGGRFKNDWERLKLRVEEIWKVVSGEKQASGELWLDLGVIREGMKADELGVVDGEVVVLDRQVGVVVGVELNDKSGQVVGGGELLVGAARIGGGSRALVLTTGGVVEVLLAEKETKRVIEAEGDWSAVDVAGFGSNVYVLDRQEVWKYAGDDEGLGARARYFGVGVTPDLSLAVDLEIDGEVFVLLSSGKILRFNRGVAVEFETKGLAEPFGSVDDLAVGEKELYILDRSNGRVVVLSKESGEFVKNVIWDGFKEVNGLVVDEEKTRVIVGKGGELWSVGYN